MTNSILELCPELDLIQYHSCYLNWGQKDVSWKRSGIAPAQQNHYLARLRN